MKELRSREASTANCPPWLPTVALEADGREEGADVAARLAKLTAAAGPGEKTTKRETLLQKREVGALILFSWGAGPLLFF